MTLQPGTRLGHYEITSLLGSGGMGEVYRAKDSKLGRDVAIKVLKEELASDPERLRRFEQEARSASALNHPNIITIHDIGKHERTPYIAMEFVEGKTLREILSEGPLPTKNLLQLASQIAEGLAKAHSAGIIHRDLKPENLMVTNDGYVKILDFGLAKLIVRETPSDSESPTATREGTVAGAVMGTVPYMSPEQLRGLPIDARSDMFSFGIVLYEMAAGIHPFQRGSTMDTASAILNEEPTPLSRCVEGIPEPVELAVNRMLLKDRDERYDSMGEITSHLHQQTLGESVTTKTSQAKKAVGKIKGHRKQLGLVALVVSALLGLGVLWIALNMGGNRTRTRIAILPFENLSGGEEEYFSEGITRDVNTEISKNGNLVVIAHGSTRRAQSQGGSYREIAEKLGADYLVDGSVSRSGTRLRITASLVDPTNDEQLWANDYDEELSVSHLFTIRGDVAQQVALALDVTLSPSERPELGSQPTENLEAYQEYLLGRFFLEKRTAEGMETAIQHYERAIVLDPDFALAHAGLADVHLILPWFSPRYSNRTGLERSQAAARRALELAPNLGEAYATLGLAQEWRFEWEGAERDFLRAIELNPEYATARHWYANMLARLRRYDEALEQIRKAQELDPLSPIINQDVGYVLGLAGDREASIRQFERTLAIDPGFSTTRNVLGWRLLEDGRYEEGRAALEHWAELTGNDPELLRQIALLVTRHAKTGEVQSIPEGLDVESILPPYSLPRFYLLIGQKEKTLEVLERGYSEGAFGMVASIMGPTFDPLRSDPRFQDLLRRMNFPE